MEKTMNLPYYALFLIRGFAKPMTRPDWRTCKPEESTMIKVYDFNVKSRMLGYSPEFLPDVRRKLFTKDANKVIKIFNAFVEASVLTRESEDLTLQVAGRLPQKMIDHMSGCYDAQAEIMRMLLVSLYGEEVVKAQEALMESLYN